MSYRTMTSGWQGAPYFRMYGRELDSKPAISFKKRWGGYRSKTQNMPEKRLPPIADSAVWEKITRASWNKMG